MEENRKLVRRQSEMTTTLAALLGPQEVTLLRELRITATNSKSELTDDVNAEWLRVLSKHPAEAIESAFRGWRDVSPFMPAISEILSLIAVWYQAMEAAERVKERECMAQARARGELIDFADIKDMLRKIAEKAGPVPSIAEMAKAIPEMPAHEFPPKAELERRRNEQLEKVREKYGAQ